MPASVATTGGQNLEKLLMFPLEKAQAAGPDIIFPNVQKFLSLYLAYPLRFLPLGRTLRTSQFLIFSIPVSLPLSSFLL